MNLRHKEAWERFHRENPQVYEHLERLAFKLKNKGVQRWSIKSLWEVLRWEMAVNTNAPVSEFRLNNNFTSHYARALMERNPDDLAGFFEIRERHATTSLL